MPVIKSLAATIVVALLVGVVAPLSADTHAFSDVPPGHWAEKAIGWAVDNDITEGVELGRFDLNGTVTRARLVDFLYRFHNLVKGLSNPEATDADIAHLDALYDEQSEAFFTWQDIRNAGAAYQASEASLQFSMLPWMPPRPLILMALSRHTKPLTMRYVPPLPVLPPAISPLSALLSQPLRSR